MTPLHLGPMHPIEQVLTLVLAIAPFVVLGIVIAVRRRQDEREDERQDEREDQRDR
jgi:hypothetical protein